MRRLTQIIALLLVLALPAWAASVRQEPLEDTFESEENLALFDFSTTGGYPPEWLDQVEVSIVTQAPGDQVYAWFGHVGLMVEAPGNEPVMYDWGVFSFSPAFYADFCFGRLYYALVRSRASWQMNQAIEEDRTVTKVALPLTREQKAGVLDFTTYNAQEENQTYLYHYYYDNCSTRVRDIAEAATGGGLREWAEERDCGMTWREASTRYMDRSRIVSFTLNFLQGPAVDQTMSLRDACFLPDVLASAASDYFGSEPEILHQGHEEMVGEPDPLVAFLIAGLAAGIILHSLFRKSRRAWGIVSLPFWLYLAVLSSVLLFMMLFTNHDVTWDNENIIFCNPLVVLCLFSSIHAMAKGKKATGNLAVMTSRILLTLSIATVALKGFYPEAMPQENLDILAFLIPVYASMALVRLEKRRNES